MMEEWCNRVMEAFASTETKVQSNDDRASLTSVVHRIMAAVIPSSSSSSSRTSNDDDAKVARSPPIEQGRTIKKYRVLPGYLWSTNHPSPAMAPPEPTVAPPQERATVTLRLVSPHEPPSNLVASMCQSWVHRQQLGDGDFTFNSAPTNCWYEKTVSYHSDGSVRVRLWDDSAVASRVEAMLTTDRDSDVHVSTSKTGTSVMVVPVDRVVLCLTSHDVKDQVERFQASLTNSDDASPPLVVVLVRTRNDTNMASLDGAALNVQAVYSVSLSGDDTSEMDDCFQSMVESILQDRAAASKDGPNVTVNDAPTVTGSPAATEDVGSDVVVPSRAKRTRPEDGYLLATVKKPKRGPAKVTPYEHRRTKA